MIAALIIIPIAALLTGVGIFAWRREKPMWFWAGTEIKEEDISDVPAYNRANAVMWVSYSLVFWAAAIVAMHSVAAAGVIVIAGAVGGAIAMMLVWHRIYAKYSGK
jgi:hypothetical protein